LQVGFFVWERLARAKCHQCDEIRSRGKPDGGTAPRRGREKCKKTENTQSAKDTRFEKKSGGNRKQ